MKKVEKYIMVVIILIAIGAIGSAIYFIKPIDKPNNNFENYVETNNDKEEYNNEIKNDSEEELPEDTAPEENVPTKTALTFYKNNKVLSSFECDGECRVVTFGYDYPEKSEYYVKTKTNEEDITYLDIKKSSNVIIEYCKNEKCGYIDDYGNDYFFPVDEKEKNVGEVLLYNVENGKYDEFDSVDSVWIENAIAFLKHKTNKVLKTDEDGNKTFKYEYTMLNLDGFSRKLSSEPLMFCYEGCSYMGAFGRFSEDVLVTVKNNKVGVEDIKTGKIIINHKYDNIYSYDENTFVAKYDDLYNVYDSKTGATLFKGEYEIVSKIDNETYFVLNKHKFQVLNDKEQVISKNYFEVKEVCDFEPKVVDGFSIYQEDGMYEISVCSADSVEIVDGYRWGENEELLKYVYDPKSKTFE